MFCVNDIGVLEVCDDNILMIFNYIVCFIKIVYLGIWK